MITVGTVVCRARSTWTSRAGRPGTARATGHTGPSRGPARASRAAADLRERQSSNTSKVEENRKMEGAHLNRDKDESNISVVCIQGCQENAGVESFKMSPHMICL